MEKARVGVIMEQDRKIKLVIWGTGGQAGSTINYNKTWLDNVEIVCFVNNSHVIGQEEMFYNKKVVAPQQLLKMEFDYILILSSFVEEISSQIINELNITKNHIISLEDLSAKIVEQSGISIIDKNVILYGKDYTEFNYVYHIEQRVASLKVVTDSAKNGNLCKDVIRLEDLPYSIFDYILVINKDDTEFTEIKKKLCGICQSSGEKILSIQQWSPCLAYEHRKTVKEGAPFYYSLVPRPKDGLMALFMEYLRHCDYAYEKRYIPFVDMQNTLNSYLEDSDMGKKNSWEYFYTQVKAVHGKSVSQIYSQENVVIPSLYLKRNKHRDIVKKQISRKYLQDIYKKTFAIQDHIKNKALEEFNQIFAKAEGQEVVGCIYRGTDYVSIKPANHMIQPELDEFISICKERLQKWNCQYLFVATEDELALEEMKKTFGQYLLYTDQLRYKNTGDKFLAEIKNNRKNDKYLRGEEYLVALSLLTKCDYLISGQNSGLYGTLIMKESEYKDLYVFDKGKYAATNTKYL